MTAKQKYRPSLTEAMILHCIDLAKNESPISPESIQLLGVLAPFHAKIANEAKLPAYSTQRKKTVTEMLADLGGLESADNYAGSGTNTDLSNPHYWAECYEKAEESGINALTVREHRGYNEHRYLNELMTPEEVAIFESEAMAESMTSLRGDL
jgi:hypothetical protein